MSVILNPTSFVIEPFFLLFFSYYAFSIRFSLSVSLLSTRDPDVLPDDFAGMVQLFFLFFR